MSFVNNMLRFANDEQAAVALEYALLVSLVAVAMLASLTTLGTQISEVFNKVSSTLALVNDNN